MDRVTSIKQQITADRRQLGRDLRDIEARVHHVTDWRTHYRTHMGVALAAAVGGGVLLGSLTRGRPMAPRGRSVVEAIDPSGIAAHQLHDFWGGMVGALVGLASTAAVDALGKVIPGSESEFRKRQERFGRREIQ